MQLVDPEDMPAMERLTQEVLLLREKVASVEPQGQEGSENRRQQVGRTPGSGRVREQETTGRSLFLCSFYPMSNLLSSRFSRKSTSAAPGRLCLNTHPCQSGTNSSACYTFPQ